ncbi:Protein BREAST CANCER SUSCEPTIBILITY 2 homolog A [Prunus dulcis]|uniref:Protein BREAST CANCER SUSCEPTIBILITY 2 homolog A n=1 Tax=Prunus dulcis TaxID=3755 RepID=A0A4Y1REK3_PRUDU|nr:Protein BREAST CANCER SUSCEPTIBILITY 2 homolog A [Prunus dulcis]
MVSLAKPLVDISNTVGTTAMNSTQKSGVKRRLGRSSISPFKKPRTSNSPIHCTRMFLLSVMLLSHQVCLLCPPTIRVPKEGFLLDILSRPGEKNYSSNAEKYMFLDESGLNCIGAEAFVHMLACSGALMQYTSREWVTNHYKWVVWKLACYERCHLAKSFGNFLTVSNVLEELKYRYEREVNHGHRSAIKRILEGDASPSSMVVLCISAIRSNCDPNMETSSRAENSGAAKVELTDGWYSVDAVLDALLSKQLASGKLFVGQKLRIWGAALCGWAGPVSPLEVARTVTFRLHINGTYRAHWADRLGFCKNHLVYIRLWYISSRAGKGAGAPLAFNCVKSGGGAVPCTLLGVTRIYPVLYKERLSNGRSVVRSERLESQMVQSYQERCLF